jgi:hypothetical protein
MRSFDIASIYGSVRDGSNCPESANPRALMRALTSSTLLEMGMMPFPRWEGEFE